MKGCCLCGHLIIPSKDKFGIEVRHAEICDQCNEKVNKEMEEEEEEE